MNMSKLIIIIVGVLMFVLGYNFENPIIMFFGAVFIATGILFVLSTIAGYGKSQKKKEQNWKEKYSSNSMRVWQDEQDMIWISVLWMTKLTRIYRTI